MVIDLRYQTDHQLVRPTLIFTQSIDHRQFDLGAKSLYTEQFKKSNENCGLPDYFTDYQIRHLGNPSGLPEILPKIDP